MNSVSKIKLYSVCALFTVALLSCSKYKNDVIPDVYVFFMIDLLDPQFVNLNAFGESDTVNARTNNFGSSAAGFDSNGIIVYCGGPDEYYAFDRTCPHDYATNSKSVQVSIVDNISAVCPECGTEYSLGAFGTPSSGPGRYPLKNYKTSFDGRYITVWNN